MESYSTVVCDLDTAMATEVVDVVAVLTHGCEGLTGGCGRLMPCVSRACEVVEWDGMKVTEVDCCGPIPFPNMATSSTVQ